MAIRVTVSDGIGFKGAYAPDGSLYVTEAPDSGYCGIYAPDGSTYVTVSPGALFVGYYAPNGSRYVTEDLTEWSGATQVVVVSGNLGGEPVDPTLVLSLLFSTSSPAALATAGVTAERSGLGWQYDPSGKITTCPNNISLHSQEFDNGTWAKASGTVTPNVTAAPDGTLTADELIASGAGGGLVYRAYTALDGNFVYSIYAKASVSGFITFRDRITVPGVNSNTWFDLVNGTVGTSYATHNPQITSVGNGWYRCSITVLAVNASQYIGVLPSLADNATSNGSIYIWGNQFERVTYETSPRTYNPTTAAAYYGPRLDYDPATLAAKGLLVEEARTNLVLRSQELGTTPWDVSAAFNMTGVTADAVVAPDGTTTADLLLENASTGLHAAYYTTTFSDAAVKTFSVFLKARERTKFRIQIGASAMAAGVYADVDVVAGTISAATLEAGSYTAGASKIEPVGNGWYRVSVTATTPATAHVVYISPSDAAGTRSYTGVATNGFYAWGAQLELGSFATSYIPTTTASVTRTADSVSMTGTAFSSWYNQSEGTFVYAFTGMNPSGVASIPLAFAAPTSSAAVSAEAHRIRIDTGETISVRSYTATEQGSAAFAANSYVPNALTQIAFGYKVNDFAGSQDGGTPVVDASGAVPTTIDRLSIMMTPAGSAILSGWVKSFTYYNVRKPNAELQALTSWAALADTDFDYTTMTALPASHTFARTGGATMFDSTGKLTWAPENLALRSQEFGTAPWTTSGTLVSSDAATAPDGTMTADLVYASATGNNRWRYQSITHAAGQRYVESFYVKPNNWQWFCMYNPSGSGPGAVWFDLTNGVVGTQASGFTGAIESVGNGWFRCSISYTTGGAFVIFGVVDADNSIVATANGTNGVFVWGAQLERVTYQTTPRDYLPTTSAARYEPRFDYDPATLTRKGLLIEESRTNLALNSQDFGNVNWVKSAIANYTHNGTGPDGTATATEFVVDTAGGTSSIVLYRQITVTAVAHTFSLYIKKSRTNDFATLRTFGYDASANDYSYFNVATGTLVSKGTNHSAATITDAGNGWWRATVTFTSTTTLTGSAAVYPSSDGTTAVINRDGTVGLLVWGAQLEVGAFATSYIPTTTASVTRAAETCSITGASFASIWRQDMGTIVLDGTTGGDATSHYLNASDGTSSNRIVLYCAGVNYNTLITTSGVVQVTTAAAAIALNTTFRMGIAFAENNSASSTDGSSPTTDPACLMPVVSQFYIGSDHAGSGNYMNGHVRRVRHYRNRISNSGIQALAA